MRLAEDPFEIADQRLPRRRIERRKGSSRKTISRFRDEGPGETCPLSLPAGELPRGALRQVSNAKKFQITRNDRPISSPTPRIFRPAATLSKTVASKQKRLLEDHRNAAPVFDIAATGVDLPAR